MDSTLWCSLQGYWKSVWCTGISTSLAIHNLWPLKRAKRPKQHLINWRTLEEESVLDLHPQSKRRTGLFHHLLFIPHTLSFIRWILHICLFYGFCHHKYQGHWRHSLAFARQDGIVMHSSFSVNRKLSCLQKWEENRSNFLLHLIFCKRWGIETIMKAQKFFAFSILLFFNDITHSRMPICEQLFVSASQSSNI